MLSAIFALATASVAYAATVPKTACADGTLVTNAACCAFVPIRDGLVNEVFEGICGEAAHSTVRIAFHDAIGFSFGGGKGGGADGSMIAFGETELFFAANAGIDDIVGDLQPFADAHGISYADVIHFGSSVAMSLCPGAPVIQTFIGRPNATVAAPDRTVPDPFDDLTKIFARMAEAGFTPTDVVALIASHSVAAQDELDTVIAGSPFDSTPGLFDSQLFLEVQLRGRLFPGSGPHEGEVQSPIPGELRLQSDHNFARDSRTACIWQSFALNQPLMARSFATAMTKMGLLGHSANNLIDCTDLIAAAPPLPPSARQAFFPAGHSHSEIEQACATQLFPTTLSTARGPAISVPLVPPQ